MLLVRTRAWVASGVSVVMMIGSAGVVFGHESPDTEAAGAALVQLADVSSAPEQDVLDGAVAVSPDGPGVADGYLEVQGDVAMIPASLSDPIVIGADAENPFEVEVVQEVGINVEADEVIDGVIGFDGENGAVTVAVPKEDGSVQVAVVINGAEAPTEYEFAIGGGHDLRQYPDGSIGVYTVDGEFVGGIAAPWATDANGISVPTYFDVRGTSVIQVVNHQSEGFTYPIVADPWLGKALINRTAWDGRTLRVYPTDWAVCKHWYSVCAGTAARWAAWDEVQAKTPGTRENTASMRDQLYCHFDVVRFREPNKESWNLDEGRPNVSYATMLAQRCNP